MSISLRSAVSDLGGEVHGHDYRLRTSQFLRAIKAGVIPEGDGVELRDGFLRPRPIPGDPDSGGDYRLSLDRYRAMTWKGILTSDDRSELPDGWLIGKISKNRPREISKVSAYEAIRAILPPGCYATVESPVGALRSEPEPDISIIRGTSRDYPKVAPGPENVALIVEVADTSLWRDRREKKRLYAEAFFALYWLINLRIEVHTNTTGPVENPDNLTCQDFGPDDMIPAIIEGQQFGLLAVRDLLP